MQRSGFICAGCWTVDRIKMVSDWPEQEALAYIRQVSRQGGGSAHNCAINLRRLDPSVPVSTIGMVGCDDDAQFLIAQAEKHGIDTSRLFQTHDSNTSYTDVITVAGDGRRTFFHYCGANDLLLPEHFNFNDSRSRILHLGLIGLHAGLDASQPDGHNGWSAILQAARAQGLQTSIEMVSIESQRNRELVMPTLAYLDYLIINDQEIGSLAGIETTRRGATDAKACMQAAEQVMIQGSMQHIVVHFPHGAIGLSRQGSPRFIPSRQIPQSMIIGTVGAGDAFASGFLYGMHEGWDADQAIRLGHTVAAASLRSADTTGSVQSIDQCRTFAEQFPVRTV